MKPDDASRDPLARALTAWKVSPRRDPGFRAAVWARLRRQPAESWPAYFGARAPVLLGAMAVAVVAGAWGGRESAQARAEADRATVTRAYVQSLDARWMAGP